MDLINKMAQEIDWIERGLKWFKTCFHVHTPASSDFRGNKEISPKEFVKKALDAGLDIIAITDHNSANWVDNVQDAASELNNEGERRLIIIPGVEITTHTGCHLLALFETGTPSAHIHQLLGEIGIHVDETDVVDTEKTTSDQFVVETSELVNKIREKGGIVIYPHVGEESCGVIGTNAPRFIRDFISQEHGKIFEENQNTIPRELTRAVTALNNQKIHPKIIYINRSDIHHEDHFNDANRWTWIKCGSGSLSSISQIITAPSTRVSLYPPKSEKSYFLKSLTMNGGFLKDQLFCFSQGLNTIIGGTGAGKSIIIDCIKYVFDILDENDQEILERLYDVVKDKTTIRVRIQCDDSEYLIDRKLHVNKQKRNYVFDVIAPVNIFKLNSAGEPIPFESDIHDVIFPELYSQGEVGKFNSQIDRQLDFIDTIDKTETIKNTKTEIKDAITRINENTQSLLTFFQLAGGSEESISEKSLLEETCKNQEEFLNKPELKDHNNWTNSHTKITNILSKVKEITIDFFEEISEISPILESEYGYNEYSEILSHYYELENQIKVKIVDAEILVKSFQDKSDVSFSRFLEKYDNHKSEYDQIIKESKIEDLAQLNESYQENHNKLQVIVNTSEPEYDDHIKAIVELFNTRKLIIKQLQDARKKLTDIRKENCKDISNLTEKIKIELLDEVNLDNYTHNLEMIAQSRIMNRNNVIENIVNNTDPCKLSELIMQLNFNGLRSEVNLTDDAITKIMNPKTEMIQLNQTKLDFHRVNKEVLDLQTTLYEDIPKISAKMESDYKEISKLAIGQKGSIILTLALKGSSSRPLIIDQPEDSLDHKYVKEMIIPELMDLKANRQFIFCTHNQNIPALGDADLIIKMQKVEGEDICKIHDQGSFEEVVEHLLDMEGGVEAFKLRAEKYGFSSLKGGPAPSLVDIR